MLGWWCAAIGYDDFARGFIFLNLVLGANPEQGRGAAPRSTSVCGSQICCHLQVEGRVADRGIPHCRLEYLVAGLLAWDQPWNERLDQRRQPG